MVFHTTFPTQRWRPLQKVSKLYLTWKLLSDRDLLNFSRKYIMPTTRSQQSEAEYESTGSTPEMDEIRLRNNLKTLKAW